MKFETRATNDTIASLQLFSFLKEKKTQCCFKNTVYLQAKYLAWIISSELC
jgi:hypothetical protein